MHEGCTGSSKNGLEVLQKVRMRGFSTKAMPQVMSFDCHECEANVQMSTFEYECPSCGLIYAVTPCSASDVSRIQAAGKNL